MQTDRDLDIMKTPELCVAVVKTQKFIGAKDK